MERHSESGACKTDIAESQQGGDGLIKPISSQDIPKPATSDSSKEATSAAPAEGLQQAQTCFAGVSSTVTIEESMTGSSTEAVNATHTGDAAPGGEQKPDHHADHFESAMGKALTGAAEVASAGKDQEQPTLAPQPPQPPLAHACTGQLHAEFSASDLKSPVNLI